MKTKRILTSMVTAVLLTGSLAFAGPRHDQSGSTTTRVKSSKANATATTTTRTGGNTAIRTRNFATTGNSAVRTRNFATSGNTTFRSRNFATGGNTVRTGTVRNRTVYTNGTRYSSSYPYRSYRSYSYGYPYYGYGYGPSVSFGFGYPSYGYYPYDYGYYPDSYNYGSYYYNEPGYTYGSGSIVIQVQTRLARAGYYRGPIDGVMGPGTSYAIRAYERDHGLRMDGVISGQLIRNMGLRY